MAVTCRNVTLSRRIDKLRKKGETVDVLRGGAIHVLQKEKGYRFSIDAVILADFVQLKKHDHVAELGSGSGVISLIEASRFPTVQVVGIDIQEHLVAMAKRSVKAHGMETRVEILQGDIRHIRDIVSSRTFDAVICNPPYRRIGSGRLNPDEERAIARHEVAGTVDQFCRAAGLILKDGGRFFVIFPAARTVHLMMSMKRAGIEPKMLRLVHSSKTSQADFVLAAGVRGGGEGIEVMPPLYLYKRSGVYTREMDMIFETITGCRESSD